jgi:hypothetical protein
MSKYGEFHFEGMLNSITEVQEVLNSLNNRKEKIQFIEQLYNERKYWLKSALNTIDLTETATGIVAKGLHEFPDEFKESTLKNDEVLVFCQIELEYLKNLPTEHPNKFVVIEQSLKLKQIALIHAYNGSSITRENAGTIAGKYGYTSKHSGEGLYQDFLKYVKPAERTAIPTAETKKTLINKIELFESVLPLLSTEGFQRATDEINILKSHLKLFEK